MAKQLFGTDGIRGVAGQPPLDDITVFALGRALGDDVRSQHPAPRVLLGMDTRESGQHLAELVAGGLAQAGVEADFAGVLTTPGVAFLTKERDYVAGVMISASHNPFQDNGLKVFAHSGYKIPDDREEAIEAKIFALREANIQPQKKALAADQGPAADYLNHLLQAGESHSGVSGTRIVADCANGAAYALAPKLFERLGVEVEFLGTNPDGRNINLDCGSLHMDALRDRVTQTGAALGVAFDGDADRALFVASDGTMVDGDHILLLAGADLRTRHALPNDRVVTTIMANMGLEKGLEANGISMTRTQVGDKYVLEEMLASGSVLGGEQSGHIIFLRHATTGDGLLTAKMMLDLVARAGRPLSELATQLTIYPQKLKNVRVREKKPFAEVPALATAVAKAESEMDGAGRVVVRYSGTEPLVRIMVEAQDMALVDQHVDSLAAAFQAELGA